MIENTFYTSKDTKYLWTHQLYVDTRFQNNLYSQVISRQVQMQLLRRRSTHKTPLYFLLYFWCLANCTEHACITTSILMQWMLLLVFTIMHCYDTVHDVLRPRTYSAVLGFGVWNVSSQSFSWSGEKPYDT